MASLQALASFLQQQGPYINFSQIALSITQPTFQSYFDGRDLTLLVPSDDAFSTGASNTRGYGFNTSDATLMLDVLTYHIIPGQHPLEFNLPQDDHVLLPTAHSADLDKNQPQPLVFQMGPAILNQRVVPKVINKWAVNNTMIYALDTVLGYPATYSWEANNTGLMEEWKSFEVVAGGIEIDDYDGSTVFAPADKTWNVPKLANQIPVGELKDVYNNHVIPGLTLWSPNFMNGTYTSASGFNYTFNKTLSGQFTVTLNGTTVNITHSDILTWNGVIHLLDGPLWTNQNTSYISSSDSSSSTSVTATSISSPSNQSTATGETAKTGLSQGTVAGIAVAAIVAVLSALIVVYGLWKRRQRHIKVFEHKDGSIDGPDLPTAALRTSPFTSRPDLSEVIHNPDNDVTARSMSPATLEKRSTQSSSMASTSNTFLSASASPVQNADFPPITEEVIERLLQTISIRIDSVAGPEETSGEAPPEYSTAR